MSFNPTLESGWHELEKNEHGIFRWSSGCAVLNLGNHKMNQMIVEVGNITKPRVLTVRFESGFCKTFKVNYGKDTIIIPIKNCGKIEFITEELLDPKEENKFSIDDRKLGIQFFSFAFLGNDNDSPESIKVEIDKFEYDKSPSPSEDSIKYNKNINPSLKLASFLKDKSHGILYIGQYGTSGYAAAAKGYLYDFFTNGIPVTWEPLKFDDSIIEDTCQCNVLVKSLINKKIDGFDTVILHSTPDLWPSIRQANLERFKNKKVIGYTVWETSKLPPKWVSCINKCVDEVWCPSTYNHEVFVNSGVSVNIRVVPHIFIKQNFGKCNVILNETNKEPVNGVYTFYNISELNIRKGVEDLVNVYCKTFSNKDKVRLILKLHHKSYSRGNRQYCVNIVNEIMSKFLNCPEIILLIDNLDDNQLSKLHEVGDCYVSLCKSEGFGLTIFDAYNYGKRIITTGYGGQVDYLGKDYPGLVKYKIGPVTGMKGFNLNYEHDGQEWAYPDLNHASELIRNIYEK
jgi:hypothetical protein